MLELWQDVRFGARMLRRKPVFTAVALLSLALGIGATTAIFTLVDVVFRRPLPGAKKPDELMALFLTVRDENGEYSGWRGFSYEFFRELDEHTDAFSSLALYQWQPMSLSGGDEPERVTGMYVSADYFTALGVEPLQGRFFHPEEATPPGGPPVAVLGHGCWTRLFGADPAIVGRTVDVNGTRFDVVGVAPRGFKGTETAIAVDVFLPVPVFRQLSPFAAFFDQADASLFRVFGRLRPGVTPEVAAAQAQASAERLTAEYLSGTDAVGSRLVPLREANLPQADRATYLGYRRTLLATVLVILLVACLNVAGLLTVRGLERGREIATRRALGASRGRIVRQLVVESVLLFLVGGALSLVMAYVTLDLLWSLRPPSFAENAIDLRIDAQVIGFALLLALVTGLVFGLFPALRASNPNLVASLKETAAAGLVRSRRSRWLRPGSLLVGAQVALALVALLGAAALLQSLENAQESDLGFEPENLAVMTLSPGDLGLGPEQARELYRRVLERVEALPGVESATLSENRLLRGAVLQQQIFLAGAEHAVVGGGRDFHRVNVVVPGFFATAGIPLLGGRDFDASFAEDGPAVAVVNEMMAREAWPGQEAIGQRFHFDQPGSPPVEVIGVVGNAKYRHVQEEAQFFVYLPLIQRHVPTMTLHVRTETDPAAMLPLLRQEVRALYPELPLAEVDTMREFVAQDLWVQRMSTGFLIAFGGVALALALCGIFGLLAYSVARRQRELSLRMALGAERRQLVAGILKESLILVTCGLVAGSLIAYFALMPVIAHQLVGVEPTAVAGYPLLWLLILGVALLGSLIPALRAARVDPVRLLRSE